MTSRDQLSFRETWEVLPSFSDGRSSVGPKTVARLWRDILLRLSISVTLPEEHQGQLRGHRCALHKSTSGVNAFLNQKPVFWIGRCVLEMVEKSK